MFKLTIAAEMIKFALRLISPEDRGGFLFAFILHDMLRARWTKEMIREAILKGLDVAWEKRELVLNTKGEKQ